MVWLAKCLADPSAIAIWIKLPLEQTQLRLFLGLM